MDINVRRKQLKFQAWHRGTKECDILLGKFADSFVDDFITSQLDQFAQVLDQQDVELYAWITGGILPEHLETNKVYKSILGYYS